ncbi:MAG TPA: hypothetical protein VK500_02415 [Nitrospiraceae bacterium]|nr:hypothetical protein [Nitrospiraceae bacterium]
MPKGSAVEDVEGKLKREYPGNPHAVYGTLNKIGLMHGNKATAKGLKKAKSPAAKRMKKMSVIARKVGRTYA